MAVAAVGRVRIAWLPVVERAAEIADSYATPVTLRQLHYRCVSEQLIPNTESAYKTLSARTAQARREGWFPTLLDQGREIHGLHSWTSPQIAVRSLASGYRRDRRDGQDELVWLVLEKATLLEQVESWVREYGVPVVALRGYGSQTIIDQVRNEVESDQRFTTALYVGDLDASGEDIERDLEDRTEGCFAETRRLAVLPEQIDEYGLVPAPGKYTDTRAGRFLERHGELIQVEVEAIDPAVLERLVLDAVEPFIDQEHLGRVLAVEARERQLLRDAADQLAELDPSTEHDE